MSALITSIHHYTTECSQCNKGIGGGKEGQRETEDMRLGKKEKIVVICR